MMDSPSKEEIFIIGEVLRLKMHKDPSLIKDRRYHLRSYSCCFVGQDAISWLVRSGECSSVNNALACLRLLQEAGILHHVCDDHIVKNEYLFYRFRIDDGTFFVDSEYRFYHQAIMIHQRISGDSSCRLFEVKYYNDVLLENCFVASNFVRWLVANDVVTDNYAAQILGQHFLDIMVIRPVHGDTGEFYGDETYYRFIFDLEWESPLHKLLHINEDDFNTKQMTQSFKKFSINDVNKKYLSKFWKGLDDDSKSVDITLNKAEQYCNADDEFLPTLQPVVIREVTAEELLNKDSPYKWKNLRITSDLVGFGFIIRGNGPCYVQAVDPTGPAAAVGLKVRMYIYSVNGKVVIRLPHKDVAGEIMKGIVVDLVVLQHHRLSH